MVLLRRFFQATDARAVLAWSAYDFGNSGYALIMLSFAFPIWFKATLAPPGRGDFLWGLLVSGSALLAAFAAPWVGAWTDARGRRKRPLTAFTAVAVMGAAALGLSPSLGLAGAVILFLLANVSLALALVLYDAFLPQLSTRATVGRISGLGWGLGYLGGVAALLTLRPWYGAGLEAVGDSRYRLTFALAAAFFLAFALPALLVLRDPPPGSGARAASARPAWRRALGNVGETVGSFRRDRRLPLFLAAAFLLNNGLVTLFTFLPVYAQGTLGIPVRDIGLLLVVVQLVGMPSTLLAGWLADRLGTKPVLLSSLALWCLIVILAAGAENARLFYPVAALTGLVIGSSQSIVRSWLARLAPAGRSAEYYGFNALAGKVSAAIGPLAFGTLSLWLGPRAAMISLLAPLLLAAALFARVRED